MNAVEDQNGDVDRVALYNVPINKSMDRLLPNNAIVAVKEPFYTSTIDGGVLIRIDHPSDLIQLRSDSTLIPSSMKPVSKTSLSPIELKEMGNEAFRRRDWETAADCYSTALGMNLDNDDLRRTLHSNRSQARINLGHYELAIQDALVAIEQGDHASDENKSQNRKSLHRAGRAAYELGDFFAAKQYFSRGVELSPENKDLLLQLQRTEKRMKEQNIGEFDFIAMSNSATEDNTVLDHASFLGNTKVASAEDHGRGLFATNDLAPGDVILVEKAFYATFERDVPKEKSVIVDVNKGRISLERQAERIYGTINKILHNPKQASRYLDLCHGGEFQNKSLKFVDGMATVDTFLVQAIDRLNGFDFPGIKSTKDGSGEKTIAAGIWLHVSLVNHSCVPNADRSFIGDMMVVRATRGIKAGEEISLSYLVPNHSYLERKERLYFYGIECDCPLCEVEKFMPAQVLRKRATLVDEVNQFLSTNGTGPPSTLPASAIKNAEYLMTQLEETYPEELYQHLPRLACVRLARWLCLVGGPPEQRLERALRGLRNYGYFVEMKANGITVDRSSAIVESRSLAAPTIAASACMASGKIGAARQFRELRKEMYTILYACENGLDDK
ncbi:hypothetical protein INS49_002786 [Diaporthe citri]|uniref:uncharacterized protein n=1 Tax=Diaporthe citri TaxID=83186 RepID=UPI001C81EAF3|nr:uncharacterized protein INS49_002786 [Diaporthe citri]KAG6368573.1 hypothetical protein INS49_002786 [Diaporthe citri]